mmetsp:Transcript_4921/g.13424  ORF Transcript_4921/g.13424 Transcript_4921/m.13424 type:complete len:90 (+) Transcript_4921:45-314(+)
MFRRICEIIWQGGGLLGFATLQPPISFLQNCLLLMNFKHKFMLALQDLSAYHPQHSEFEQTTLKSISNLLVPHIFQSSGMHEESVFNEH